MLRCTANHAHLFWIRGSLNCSNTQCGTKIEKKSQLKLRIKFLRSNRREYTHSLTQGGSHFPASKSPDSVVADLGTSAFAISHGPFCGTIAVFLPTSQNFSSLFQILSMSDNIFHKGRTCSPLVSMTSLIAM